jgi:hemoglobin
VIGRILHDYRAQRPFAGINTMPVKESVALHLREIAGGPCKYQGASIAMFRTGMGITGRQFDIMDD